MRAPGKGQAAGSFPAPRDFISLCNRDREEKEKQAEGDANEQAEFRAESKSQKVMGDEERLCIAPVENIRA